MICGSGFSQRGRCGCGVSNVKPTWRRKSQPTTGTPVAQIVERSFRRRMHPDRAIPQTTLGNFCSVGRKVRLSQGLSRVTLRKPISCPEQHRSNRLIDWMLLIRCPTSPSQSPKRFRTNRLIHRNILSGNTLCIRPWVRRARWAILRVPSQIRLGRLRLGCMIPMQSANVPRILICNLSVNRIQNLICRRFGDRCWLMAECWR